MSVSNAELLPEVIASKAAGKINTKLATMLQLIANTTIEKRFAGHPMIDEMKGQAIVDLVRCALSFKPELSDNPLSFYVVIAYSSGTSILSDDLKYQNIKEDLTDA